MVPRERSKKVPSLRKISSKGSWYRKCGWVGTTSQTCSLEIRAVSFGSYCPQAWREGSTGVMGTGSRVLMPQRKKKKNAGQLSAGLVGDVNEVAGEGKKSALAGCPSRCTSPAPPLTHLGWPAACCAVAAPVPGCHPTPPKSTPGGTWSRLGEPTPPVKTRN